MWVGCGHGYVCALGHATQHWGPSMTSWMHTAAPFHSSLRPLPTPYTPQEAMRLKPVGADGTAIDFKHDIQLGGHTVPAGTVLWVPFHR